MYKIWYRNPSKSEVIGRCGGVEKTEWPRRTDKSRMLKKRKKRTCSCLHDYQRRLLVSVHFQMNYLLYHLQNQRQYRYCESPNCSKHYSKLTSLFPLLLMWWSWDENSWGLHFSILFLSIGRMKPFLNNDHLNTLGAC